MEEVGPHILMTGFKALIARGKRSGFVTYDELSRALPEHLLCLEQREDLMWSVRELGINIIEAEDSNGEDGNPVGGGPSSPQGHPPLEGGPAFEALDSGAAAAAELRLWTTDAQGRRVYVGLTFDETAELVRILVRQAHILIQPPCQFEPSTGLDTSCLAVQEEHPICSQNLSVDAPAT